MCIRDRYPYSIPKLFSKTIATGAKQFVVQDPLEITLCSFFKSLLFTPCTIVKSTSFPGADIITFYAPAFKCFPAVSLFKNKPVHSKTISAPTLPQGKFAGSLSAKTFIFWFKILKPSFDVLTSCGRVPCVLSYFIKCALVSMEPRSLIPTTWILSF